MNDKLLTGNIILDKEHKELIETLEMFLNLESSDENTRHIIARRLISYCSDHFQHEEDLMKLSNYKKYTYHIMDHERIQATLRDHLTEYVSGKCKRETLILVYDMFLVHVHSFDIDFAIHLGNKKAP